MFPFLGMLDLLYSTVLASVLALGYVVWERATQRPLSLHSDTALTAGWWESFPKDLVYLRGHWAGPWKRITE